MRDHGEITARSLGWLVGHLRRGLGGGGLCDAQELAHLVRVKVSFKVRVRVRVRVRVNPNPNPNLLRRRGVDEARADNERAW